MAATRLFHSIHLLAFIRFGIDLCCFAAKFKWTNDGGNVDLNSRYFSKMADKYTQV